MEDSQLTKTQANTKVNILAVILFFIIFVPSSFNQRINSISLYVLIPLLFLYSLIKNPKLLLNYKPILYFFLLLCWSLLSMIKSIDLDTSLIEIRRLVGVFLLCYILVRFCFINTKYVYIFYLLYILKFFTIVYYGYTHDMEEINERFNLDELNANVFGYFGFFAVISAFLLWQSVQSNSLVKIFLFVLFVLCISFSIISCFYAASRAGIVMSILMAASLIMIYYFYPFSKKSTWGIILMIIIVTTILPVLNYYYKGSILEKRMEINSFQEESRFGLAKYAIIVGIQNPVFGVGPGNYVHYNIGRSFSHCTYTELFANNGIIALFLFLYILYYFYKKNRELYLLGHSWRKNALYFCSFIFLYCLYNLFYGFHTNLFLMGFFFIVLVHLEKSLEQEEN